MCANFEEETTVTEELTIFKSTVNGSSEYEPRYRSPIPGWDDRGEELHYPIGARVVSPSGPGIMGYAKQFSWGHGIYWRELRIPAGAKIRRGEMEGYDIVAASEVFVVGEAKEPK